jgi:hypothetical protein
MSRAARLDSDVGDELFVARVARATREYRDDVIVANHFVAASEHALQSRARCLI